VPRLRGSFLYIPNEQRCLGRADASWIVVRGIMGCSAVSIGGHLVSRPREPVGLGGLPRLGSRRARIGDTLVAAVGARKLEPGAAYSAAELADQLGASAEAVQEVMTDLAAEGLVEPIGSGGFRISAPTVAELREMIELRLLIEIPAVRKVADQGVSDSELAVLERLAGATIASARRDDMLGYINADLAFHLYLLGLAGHGQLVEVVRILRSRSRLHGLRDKDSVAFMVESADEHLELVNLLADGRASAADDLLRRHISRIAADWPAG
jgi:DNA-binding GntR family transcriptional regulator